MSIENKFSMKHVPRAVAGSLVFFNNQNIRKFWFTSFFQHLILFRFFAAYVCVVSQVVRSSALPLCIDFLFLIRFECTFFYFFSYFLSSLLKN